MVAGSVAEISLRNPCSGPLSSRILIPCQNFLAPALCQPSAIPSHVGQPPATVRCPAQTQDPPSSEGSEVAHSVSECPHGNDCSCFGSFGGSNNPPDWSHGRLCADSVYILFFCSTSLYFSTLFSSSNTTPRLVEMLGRGSF